MTHESDTTLVALDKALDAFTGSEFILEETTNLRSAYLNKTTCGDDCMAALAAIIHLRSVRIDYMRTVLKTARTVDYNKLREAVEKARVEDINAGINVEEQYTHAMQLLVDNLDYIQFTQLATACPTLLGFTLGVLCKLKNIPARNILIETVQMQTSLSKHYPKSTDQESKLYASIIETPRLAPKFKEMSHDYAHKFLELPIDVRIKKLAQLPIPSLAAFISLELLLTDVLMNHAETFSLGGKELDDVDIVRID